MNKNNPMDNTVIVRPSARNSVYHGSLLPVNLIAGKEYMPPISIPTTRKPGTYAGMLFSNEVGLGMLLLVTTKLTWLNEVQCNCDQVQSLVSQRYSIAH